MRPAAIRCRESFVLSSRKQVAALAVEREESLLGYRLRLDCAVVQDMSDRETASGEAPRHQKTAVAIERLAFRAHRADAKTRRGIEQAIEAGAKFGRISRVFW